LAKDVARDAVTRALLAQSGIESGTVTTNGPDGGPVIRLTYHGATSEQPLLSTLSRDAGVDFTILEASVGHLKTVSYGRFTLRLQPRDSERLPKLLQLSDALGVRHEILR